MRQRMIDFERGASEPPTTMAETAQVATDTSLPPPPPPLVRPDRQIVYEGTAGHGDWPTADSLHDHDTITVDRIHNDIDGPSHRFVIKRGDTVEAWFGKDNLQAGTVVGISHARRKVRVAFTEGSNTEESSGQWFAVGAIYREQFERLVASEVAIASELTRRFQATELAVIASRMGSFDARRNNKQQNVQDIYRKMLATFLLDGSVSLGMGESYVEAVKQKVLAVTEADWDAF